MKKKIFNIIETLVLIFSCIICTFLLLQKFVFKENGILGYRTFVIVTSSMRPSLDVGDVILVKKIDTDKIKINDIITYEGMESDFKDKIITHKVKNIILEDSKKIFYTKGITNSAIDPAVYEEQIYGKVIYKFKILSFLSKIIRSKFGYIIFILIPLSLIFVKEMINIKKALN